MTQVWGHRGALAYAPENTLPSFELALAQGADGVEFDVQLTKDGIPVVIHDEAVDRTTSGAGPVAGFTLARLQALDACAGRTEFAGVRIPTLTEVLEVLAPSSATINIELKNSVVEYPGLEEKVVAQVGAFGVEDRVVVSSFNHESLLRVRKLAPELQLGVLYQDILVKPWAYTRKLGIPAVHPPALAVTKKYVQRAHEAGVAVRPWGILGERMLRRLLRWGVDAVFVDDPDVALALR